MLDQAIGLGRSFDEYQPGPTRSENPLEMPSDGRRVVPHREPIQRVAENSLDLGAHLLDAERRRFILRLSGDGIHVSTPSIVSWNSFHALSLAARFLATSTMYSLSTARSARSSLTMEPTRFRAMSAGVTWPEPKKRACRAESRAVPMASAVESVVDVFLMLTPSAVLPSRISRNTVASKSITGGATLAGRSYRSSSSAERCWTICTSVL